MNTAAKSCGKTAFQTGGQGSTSPNHTKVQQEKRRAAVAQVMLLHAAILWSSGRHQAGSQGELIVGIGPIQ